MVYNSGVTEGPQTPSCRGAHFNLGPLVKLVKVNLILAIKKIE